MDDKKLTTQEILTFIQGLRELDPRDISRAQLADLQTEINRLNDGFPAPWSSVGQRQ